MHDAITIVAAIVSTLVAIVLALVSSYWRSTMLTVSTRLDYERSRVDALTQHFHVSAVQFATLEAESGNTAKRLETIEEDLNLLRREMHGIAQSLTRIETQLRKSNPPARGSA